MKMIRPTLMLLLLVSSGCALKPAAAQREIAMSSNRFAWDLYAKLAEKKGNLFFSPSSVHTALAMTCAGSDGNGLSSSARIGTTTTWPILTVISVRTTTSTTPMRSKRDYWRSTSAC